jgi:2-oxoglutarate ferredoxin oxidoreductase subunit beta
VYGLTKGQFSATSDRGSKSKKGVVNTDAGIDMVSLALQMGATFVARSFSGDKDQLVPLIKAGLAHKGAAFIDCISPCVQFNNHVGSTKSFDYVREHNEAVNELDVIMPRDEIKVDYKPGETVRVQQHDGSILSLHKLNELYNPNSRAQALGYLQARQARGQIVTGLLFVDPDAGDLHDAVGTIETPLNQLNEAELVPGAAALARINEALR